VINRKPSDAAPTEKAIAPRAGDRIRWLGRLWRVNWAHRGLISIVSIEAPTFELINENGIDGPYEVLR
jgi:hypothetical protein